MAYRALTVTGPGTGTVTGPGPGPGPSPGPGAAPGTGPGPGTGTVTGSETDQERVSIPDPGADGTETGSQMDMGPVKETGLGDMKVGDKVRVRLEMEIRAIDGASYIVALPGSSAGVRCKEADIEPIEAPPAPKKT